jgi:hypothetical protein
MTITRNGICGIGFHVARFAWTDDYHHVHRMMATIFPEEGACAVLDVDELAKDNIEFGCGNSWRGDHFEPALREAITRQQEAQS